MGALVADVTYFGYTKAATSAVVPVVARVFFSAVVSLVTEVIGVPSLLWLHEGARSVSLGGHRISCNITCSSMLRSVKRFSALQFRYQNSVLMPCMFPACYVFLCCLHPCLITVTTCGAELPLDFWLLWRSKCSRRKLGFKHVEPVLSFQYKGPSFALT